MLDIACTFFPLLQVCLSGLPSEGLFYLCSLNIIHYISVSVKLNLPYCVCVQLLLLIRFLTIKLDFIAMDYFSDDFA